MIKRLQGSDLVINLEGKRSGYWPPPPPCGLVTTFVQTIHSPSASAVLKSPEVLPGVPT